MHHRLRIVLFIGIVAGIGILLAVWWVLPKLGEDNRTESEGAIATSLQSKPSSLLFLYPNSDPANLYLIQPASGVSQTLTAADQGVLDFTVQNDGKAVYFSQREGNGESTIYKLEAGDNDLLQETREGTRAAEGPEPEVVYECEKAICRGLAIDPQNSTLAFERIGLPGSGESETPQVWILPLGSGDKKSISVAGDPTHQSEAPSWSSKGLLGFYDSDAASYVFTDGSGKEVDRFPNQFGEGGAWHPDGEAFLAPEITYLLGSQTSSELSNLVSLADSHLILYNLDTNQRDDLTPGQGVEDASPAFSREGDFLVFGRKYLDAKRWTPGRQIWIARTDNQEARALTEAPLYNHFDFSWNSRGDQLAFVRFNQSTLNEPPEIWIYDLLSGNSSRLVVGGYQPLWLQ